MHTHPTTSVRAPLVAALAAAVGIVVAASGGPAASAATPSTVVHGTVTVGGAALAGVAVGTWSPTRGLQAETTTDVHGRFTLRTPSDVAVDAFAGARPSLSHAVFTAGPEHLVRGVIGASAPAGTPSPLSETVTEALPVQLGGGHPLRFRLQRAGRLTSTVPAGATGRIAFERGEGVYGAWAKAVGGTVTSAWLVPGRYHVYWDPKAGYAPTRTWVDVTSGTTALAASALPVMAPTSTVLLRVTSGGSPVGAGVPVVQLVDGQQQPASSTDATGTAVEAGLSPGTSTFVVGEYFDDPDEGLEGPPTSDDLLPATVTVTVPPGGATVAVDVALTPAAKLTGTATVANGHTVTIAVENAHGDVVRTGSAVGPGATIALGGMPAGAYTVYAEDVEAQTYDRVAVTLPAAGGSSAPTALPRRLTPSIPDPVVRGRSVSGEAGSVTLTSSTRTGSFSRTHVWASSGRYSIAVLPGRYVPKVVTRLHEQRTAAAVTITGSRRLDLAPGPRFAGVRVRLAVHGHPVAEDLQVHGPRVPDLDGRPSTVFDLTRTSSRGVSAASSLRAGRYTWVRSLGPLPAVDGPWYYGVPAGSFTLRSGRTLDLGTRSIAVRGG